MRDCATIPLPSVERLHELLDYDPDTGVFRWKVRRGSTVAGAIAGRTNGSGHRQIAIDGVRYQAHRLAWKIATGNDPVDTIDHRNRNPDDNRFANLREATKQQQSAHRTAFGVSQYLGVSWHKGTAKWVAQTSAHGKKRHLGYFVCEDDAARAYDAAAREHFGEFASLNFSG